MGGKEFTLIFYGFSINIVPDSTIHPNNHIIFRFPFRLRVIAFCSIRVSIHHRYSKK